MQGLRLFVERRVFEELVEAIRRVCDRQVLFEPPGVVSDLGFVVGVFHFEANISCVNYWSLCKIEKIPVFTAASPELVITIARCEPVLPLK